MSSPNEELLRALEKLEEFTQNNLKERTRFEEIKDLLQTLFFTRYRIKKESKERYVHSELIRSVSTIKSYLPLIDQYRHGNPEEQKFAALVTRTIERYNEAILASPNEKKVEKLTIESGPRIAYQRLHSDQGHKIDMKKIYSVFKMQKPPSRLPSQEEVDTLKMKAIRLIESESGFKEALIETFKDQESGSLQEIESDGKTVTLMQTWTELPGEVHRIVGAFKREARHSIPIKDSFKIFLESVQPGHPYPPQHMGWSLSHWLIPSSVLWIDQIPLFRPLLERKKKMAEALLPKGPKNLRARKLYRLKKIAFDESPNEYLTYHQELAHAIVRASPYGDEELFHKVINPYYEAIAKQQAPFDALCHTSEELTRVFIDLPFEKIEELRLKGEQAHLFEKYQAERERQKQLWVEQTIDDSPYDKVRKNYLLQMGPLFGEAAALLLQVQLSEKLNARPPPLSDFELKIQACAFKHLIDFLEELEDESDLDNVHEQTALKARMRMELQAEIELFSLPSFEQIDSLLQNLTEETISYFHARFHEKG